MIYRRKTSYEERVNQPGFDEAAIRQLLEDQHRSIIEGLRSGEIPIELFPPPPPPRTAASASAGGTVAAPVRTGTVLMPAPPSLIRVLLTNPASWLTAGSARLLVEVRAREPEGPIPNAVVEVSFEGAPRPFIFKTITDAWGRAEIGFPLPKFGPSGASLVIRASCEFGHDEIRYSLRPKSSNAGD